LNKIQLSGTSASRTVLLAALFASTLAASSAALAVDPVIFSFATVGDTRQDPTSPDATTLMGGIKGTLLPQDAQWLQNSKAWARILRTVQSQKANLLLVNGDMIMGYGRAIVPAAWTTTAPNEAGVVGSDLVKFYTQYAYWRGMVANSLETGTYVLPVPGNHEVQCSYKVSTIPSTDANACAGSTVNGGKNAYVENENAWRANMSDLIGDLATNVRFQSVVGTAAQNVSGLTTATAPTATTDSGIVSTDQSLLSYSFDIPTAIGLLHFAVINTDPAGGDTHAPTGWLSSDFSAAQARGAVKYFVFGHKPAFTYNYNATGTIAAAGLDAVTTPLVNNFPPRDAFWSLIAQYNATYFCGHEHTYHIGQFMDPTATSTNTPYQVLVGSGGSPFDAKGTVSATSPYIFTEPAMAAPTDRYYAWAMVRVHQSGAVTLDAYGFNDGFGPTQLIQSISNLQ